MLKRVDKNRSYSVQGLGLCGFRFKVRGLDLSSRVGNLEPFGVYIILPYLKRLAFFELAYLAPK